MLSELMRNIVEIYFMYFCINNNSNSLDADPSGRAFDDVALRLLACWEFGFEFLRGHGYHCLLSVVLSGRDLCVGLIARLEQCFPNFVGPRPGK
jgi:hypothetical protein